MSVGRVHLTAVSQAVLSVGEWAAPTPRLLERRGAMLIRGHTAMPAAAPEQWTDEALLEILRACNG